MDAILFGSNPRVGDIADAIKHLADHKELYWTVGFKIAKKYFSFPLLGFIHVAGKQVEYKATINQILPFEPAHYENAAVKPESWRQEWKDVKRRPHLPQENTFIITRNRAGFMRGNVLQETWRRVSYARTTELRSRPAAMT